METLREESEVIENEVIETNEPEVNKDETPSETVKRALEELQNDGDGDTQEAKEPASEVEKQANPKDTTKPVKGKKDLEFDPELLAPDRFNAEQKELFNKIPYKGLKKALHKTVRDLQAVATKDADIVTKQKEFYSGIEKAIKPHVDTWAQMKLSPDEAIRELIGTQNLLTKSFEDGRPDMATRERTLRQVAAGCGIDLRKLAGGGENNGAPNAHADNSEIKSLKDEILQLRQQINPVASHYQQSLKSQQDQATESVIAELNAVKNEMDSSGKYLRPSLHDDAFIDRAGPLVQATLKTFPGISYGDALKKAHDTMIGNLQMSNQTKPIAGNNINTRAINAAVSVRGKSAPTASNGLIEIPEHAKKSPQATVEWLLQNPSAI